MLKELFEVAQDEILRQAAKVGKALPLPSMEKATSRQKVYDAMDSVIGQPLADLQDAGAEMLGVGDSLNLAKVKSRALVPDVNEQSGIMDKQDAARHMILAGDLERVAPKLAGPMLKAHEMINFFQGSQMPSIRQDLMNNALGKELSKGATSDEEIVRRVKQFLPDAQLTPRDRPFQKTPLSQHLTPSLQKAQARQSFPGFNKSENQQLQQLDLEGR